MSSKSAVRHCPRCGKIRHSSERRAHAHILSLHENKGEPGPMNAYLCGYCGGWHVGHMSLPKPRAQPSPPSGAQEGAEH